MQPFVLEPIEVFVHTFLKDLHNRYVLRLSIYVIVPDQMEFKKSYAVILFKLKVACC